VARDTILLNSSAKGDVSVLTPGRPIQQSLVLSYLPLERADASKTARRLSLLRIEVFAVRAEVAKQALLSGSLHVHDNRPAKCLYEVVLCVRGMGAVNALWGIARWKLRDRLNLLLVRDSLDDRWFWPAERKLDPIVREMRAARKSVGLSVEEEP